MKDELVYEPLPLDELAANLDYLGQRAGALSYLLEVIMNFRLYIDKFGLDHEVFNALHDHVAKELLLNETERQVFAYDYETEKKSSLN